MSTGVLRFNEKPKTGLVFLEENKLIYADEAQGVSRPRSLAIFLKNCSRLDKRLLGDFISRPDNAEVLTEYISLFNFKNVSLSNTSWDTADVMPGVLRKTLPIPCVRCWKLSGFLGNRSRSSV